MRFHRTAMAISTAVLVACGSDSVATPTGDLALGTWGGENAGVIVTDTLTHVHVGCTFGDIHRRVRVGPDGRFTYDGTFVLRAYPVYVGPELPAQFSGVLQGTRLTLSVAVNDTVEKKVVSLGPVTVDFGKEPKLGPCPICEVPGARMREALLRPRRDGAGATHATGASGTEGR